MNDKLKKGPFLCDPETGVCEIPGVAPAAGGFADNASAQKPVRLLYFTDPICSSCWAIEPQLRKLKLAYGDHFSIDYRMGGLLEGWNSYGGSDVSNPGDVARHWDEASARYGMPIDGDVWLEDPLNSSYPPSIAFKAAQLQDEKKAAGFLRRIREMVFLEKKNITKWEHLKQAALESGLDAEILKTDFEDKAVRLFNDDLALARRIGVRGFPSIFFTDNDNNRHLVYGARHYEYYEQALLMLYPQATKNAIDTTYEAIFCHYPTLTTREFSELSGNATQKAEEVLKGLYAQKKVGKYLSKNGVLWVKRQEVPDKKAV